MLKATLRLLFRIFQISRILTVRDGSIRVARNPVDGQLYYTDTQGNIYVVIRPTSGAAYDSLVYTTADHSVEYVQGFAIYDSTFYVSGNNGSTTPLTTGIISRGKLQANGSRIWSNLGWPPSHTKLPIILIICSAEWRLNRVVTAC